MMGEKIKKHMNEQIKYELESFYIYLSMVAYFHLQNLDGMAHWLRCQAHEEMIHAMKFFDHIIDRDATVTLLDVKQLKTTWNNLLEPWQDAYEHEKFITGKINYLTKISREENDYTSEPLLAWFLNEQIEEEKNTGKIARELAMVESSPEGILLLDRELATRLFTAGSPLDPSVYNPAA
ncbi:MAG TPA: ferritin [Smithellaceae bacterium]|nr:ferritin [Smithellaceae bacterium]